MNPFFSPVPACKAHGLGPNPDVDALLVILCNLDMADPFKMASALAQFLFEDKRPPEPSRPTVWRGSFDQLDMLLGRYQSATWEMERG
ncbi:MAG: hypothetical protein AAFV07_16610 [Bacteroidota bacterium]